MAYLQASTPPPNKIESFSIQNFSGGLNNKSTILKENEASDLLNMSFMSDEVMEKRKGSVVLDSFTDGTPISFLDEYKPYTDSNQLVIAFDNQIHFFDYNASTSYASVPMSDEVSGVNMNGRYFFVNGYGLYAYGKFPQVSNTYEKVTGVAVDEYGVFQLVNPPDGFTPLDTSHTRGVHHYNYTTRTMWYEPCENEIKDPLKGANVLPQYPKYITQHKGRLFVSGAEDDNDNVFITDVQNPFYFAVSLPIQLPPSSDWVRGMMVYDDAVIIGREFDIYALRGTTNNAQLSDDVFHLFRINTHTGFMNQRSVCLAQSYLFYLGSDGNVYGLNAIDRNERVLQTTMLNQQIDLFKSPLSFTREELEEAVGIYFQDEYLLSIGNRVLVYSYRHRAWTVYNNLHVQAFLMINHRLVWGNTSGQLCGFDEDVHTDNDVPFKAYWQSKNFDMDNANSYKQFREFFLVAETFKDYRSDVRVRFEIDYDDVRSENNIISQMAIWGRSIFGHRFINRNINASTPFVIGRRGRNMRFRFTCGYDILWTIASEEELSFIEGKTENGLAYLPSEDAYFLYKNRSFTRLTNEDYNQPMRIYQMNGDYELRGKR